MINRSRGEIIFEILNLAIGGESFSRIMGRANLSAYECKEYLNALQKIGYLKTEENPDYRKPKEEPREGFCQFKFGDSNSKKVKMDPHIKRLYVTNTEGLEALKRLEGALPVLEDLKKFL